MGNDFYYKDAFEMIFILRIDLKMILRYYYIRKDFNIDFHMKSFYSENSLKCFFYKNTLVITFILKMHWK